MRMTRNIALTLTAACIATASLAQSRVQPRAITANQWMPAATRPYQQQELYFAPTLYQTTPEIRLTKIEAAYTKAKKDRNGNKMRGGAGFVLPTKTPLKATDRKLS